MSNVIEFLEKMGQDASLRHATSAQMKAAMIDANIGSTFQSALLGGDRQQIETLLGAKANVCAIVFPVEGDERSGSETNSVAH